MKVLVKCMHEELVFVEAQESNRSANRLHKFPHLLDHCLQLQQIPFKLGQANFSCFLTWLMNTGLYLKRALGCENFLPGNAFVLHTSGSTFYLNLVIMS